MRLIKTLLEMSIPQRKAALKEINRDIKYFKENGHVPEHLQEWMDKVKQEIKKE